MSGGWKMSLGKLYMEQAGGLGPSKHTQLIVLQLMSCKTISSVSGKPRSPVKHGFFTLGVLRSGLTPPLTQHAEASGSLFTSRLLQEPMGFAGLWRGNLSNVMRVLPTYGARWETERQMALRRPSHPSVCK